MPRLRTSITACSACRRSPEGQSTKRTAPMWGGCGCAGRSRCRSRPRTRRGSRSRPTSPSPRPRGARACRAARRPRAGPGGASPRNSSTRFSVWPVSTMSSTTSTSRPSISPRRSFSTRTSRLDFGAHAVGGDLEEVDLDRQVELAHQSAMKTKEPRSRPDHHQLVGAGVEGRDLAGQPLDPRGDRLGRDQLVDHVRLCRHAVPPLCGRHLMGNVGARQSPSRKADADPRRERHVPYSAERDVRADRRRRRYPEFLPWCAAARVRSARRSPTARAR